MPESPAVVVPAGERADLQRTARETGEQFGRQEAQLAAHTEHFRQINGSVRDMATSVGQQATATALLAAGLEAIKANIVSLGLAAERKQGLSLQVWLAIFAAAVAAVGMVVAAIVAIGVAVLVITLG